VAGYASARLYKLFHGKDWKRSTLLTATLFPGVIFALFSVLNIIGTVENSSTAVPFVWILCLLVLWLGVSSPLVFVGAYFGFKKDAIDVPVRTNQIARCVVVVVFFFFPMGCGVWVWCGGDCQGD
jgi:transmembrane 9 superfamily member 2/4